MNSATRIKQLFIFETYRINEGDKFSWVQQAWTGVSELILDNFQRLSVVRTTYATMTKIIQYTYGGFNLIQVEEHTGITASEPVEKVARLKSA